MAVTWEGESSTEPSVSIALPNILLSPTFFSLPPTLTEDPPLTFMDWDRALVVVVAVAVVVVVVVVELEFAVGADSAEVDVGAL